MRKTFKIALMALALLLAFNFEATAQRRGDPGKKKTEKKESTNTEQTSDDAAKQDEATPAPTKTRSSRTKTDNYFDESGGFKHRLQYGFHTNAGLLSFFNGSFNLRLEPSVGYKITNWAMAGLTGGIDYYREKGNDIVVTAPIMNYGLYARLKPLKSIYVHTDYRFLRGKYKTSYLSTGQKVSITDTYRPEFNVGLSYRSGFSSWAYEIMGVYNVNHRDGSFNQLSNGAYSFRDSPLDLKIGFTYNF